MSEMIPSAPSYLAETLTPEQFTSLQPEQLEEVLSELHGRILLTEAFGLNKPSH